MDLSVLYYFDDNLTKIEAVVIYGMCARDRFWHSPTVIYLNILNEFYTAPI